jgi:pilus assembly protein CpaB
MFFRNIVLALGALLVFAGIALSLFWLSQMGGPPVEVKQEPQRPVEIRREARLEAVRPLPAGTLLRPGDFRWREIEPGEIRPGMILRKDASENEYLGAIARKDVVTGEPFADADLVKTTDRRFLSAVLKAGTRAVTIAVDAPQGSSGMVLPGDRVDVVLTQNLSGVSSDPSRKTVAETVLRNVRVVAVDQRLNLPQEKPAMLDTPPGKEAAAKEPRMPRTVTLELTEVQAEKLYVAAQLGGLQLPVRSLEGGGEALPVQEAQLVHKAQPVHEASPAQETARPTWASDVSPALKLISRASEMPPAATPAARTSEAPPAPKQTSCPPQAQGAGSTIAANVRCAPAEE